MVFGLIALVAAGSGSWAGTGTEVITTAIDARVAFGMPVLAESRYQGGYAGSVRPS